MYYQPKPTETLQSIADRFSMPVSLLLAFNDVSDVNTVFHPGETIQVPNLEDVPADAPLSKGITAASILQRARSAINKGTRYCLGKGGIKRSANLPYEPGTCEKKNLKGNLCDCSGFVCWVLGLSRQTSNPFYKKYGGWIYTDSMEADVRSDAGIFEALHVPEPGCIVVYGAGDKIGHVGIVSEVQGGKMKKVIHCSSGNDSRYKDAIQETAPTVFNRPDALWGKYGQVI